MNNITRITLGLIAIVFGALVLFANLSTHFNWFEYKVIMRVIGLTISTTMAVIFAFWLKAEPEAHTFKDVM